MRFLARQVACFVFARCHSRAALQLGEVLLASSIVFVLYYRHFIHMGILMQTSRLNTAVRYFCSRR